MQSPLCNCRNRNLRTPDRHRIVWSEFRAKDLEKCRLVNDRNRCRFRSGSALRQHSKIAAFGVRNRSVHAWYGADTEAETVTDAYALNNQV